MTAAPDAMHITAVRDRVREHLAGRERELGLVLAAVAAGRDIVLGPPAHGGRGWPRRLKEERMPVIIVATVTPLPEHRDGVKAAL